jgi:hypothetical protein
MTCDEEECDISHSHTWYRQEVLLGINDVTGIKDVESAQRSR